MFAFLDVEECSGFARLESQIGDKPILKVYLTLPRWVDQIIDTASVRFFIAQHQDIVFESIRKLIRVYEW